MILQSISILLLLGAGFIAGMFTLFGYMLWRMMRNDGWDDSNITNAQRLLSHVVLHPNDFGKMYYLTVGQKAMIEAPLARHGLTIQRPFWYVSRDEFSEVVNTRPPE